MSSTGPIDKTLSGSEDYFLQVMIPNKQAFFGNQSAFAAAINFATSLFHFHEWLFDEFKTELESFFGATFNSKGAFWKAVEASNPNFGYMRDVTNASKHVRIGGKYSTSTGMSHIANTHIVEIGYGHGYGVAYGGGNKVVFDDGGNQIGFDTCAQELFDYWQKLLESLTGKVFV